MKAAVEGVVGFDDEAAPQLTLEAGVELIALGYANRRVEAAREVREARAESRTSGESASSVRGSGGSRR
jgi:hypothetical protein